MFLGVKNSTRLLGKRFISFSQMGVNPTIVKQLEKQHIFEATTIQKRVIPLGLRKCSPLVVSSETGSGKTIAYLIPYLESYLEDPSKRMLIFVPQRELGYQVNKVLHQLIPEVKSSVLVSGSDGINRGKKPNVIIGTPTLMNEFIKDIFGKADVNYLQEKGLAISHIVLDEADMMLTQKPNKCPIVRSLSLLQKLNSSLQVIFVGATLPRRGKRSVGGIIQSLYPSTFWCEGDYSSRLPPSVHIRFEQIQNTRREDELVKLLPSIQQRSSLIFVNSESSLDKVCFVLNKHGISYQTMTKKLQSEERKEVLKSLSSSSHHPLCTVCCGLVARGLDTTMVDFVLNYDFPSDVKQFIHRCGRTGRGGKTGEVVCFVRPEDKILYESIQRVGVTEDLSSLYSRHRRLNRRYKEHQQRESVSFM